MAADSSVLLNQWLEACEDFNQPQDGYRALRHSLRNYLPADASAGIAFRDEAPIVIGVTKKMLLWFSAPGSGRAAEASSLSLMHCRGLKVSCWRESTNAANYWTCEWTAAVSGAESLALLTREPAGAGFAKTNGGERAMKVMASHLGWLMPESPGLSG